MTPGSTTFFKIEFFQPILFHIIAVEECCMHGHCVVQKSSFFFSRAVPFDWSCLSGSVKGDMLLCMVPAGKLIPGNLPCMFCSFSLLYSTCDLAHFINFARLCQRLVPLSWRRYSNTSIWLTVLCLDQWMFKFTPLIVDFVRESDVGEPKEFSRCWLKKECILAIDQFFKHFLLWIF